MNSSIRDQILAKYKEEYISLLKSTEREGIDSLISWLSTETDFFTAPASTNKHGSYEGGLVRHSLSVYRILSNFSKNIPEARKDSIILIALLHDLCNVNFYIRTFRNLKNESGKWERVEIYGIFLKIRNIRHSPPRARLKILISGNAQHTAERTRSRRYTLAYGRI